MTVVIFDTRDAHKGRMALVSLGELEKLKEYSRTEGLVNMWEHHRTWTDDWRASEVFNGDRLLLYTLVGLPQPLLPPKSRTNKR